MAINVGILGLAHGHVNSYIGRWNREEALGVRAVAAWDHDAARVRTAREKQGLQIADSPEALLAQAGLDAVVVAAETSMHAELTEKAAAAGKAIIVQKPIALTMAEADRMVAAVERAGAPFTMAWQMRVDPQNLRMKSLVEAGTIGRVFMLRRRHGLPTHVWANFEKSWHVDPRLNRDIWADDAAHPIDFIYWMLGAPASVTAELGSLCNPKIPTDHGIAVFRYPDGTFAEVCCSFACVAGENTTEIVGEKGVIIQNYGDVPSSAVPVEQRGPGLKWYLHETRKWTASEVPSPPGQGDRIAGLAGPLAEFLHARRPPIATAQEGRNALRLLLACYESSEQGRRVPLADAPL